MHLKTQILTKNAKEIDLDLLQLEITAEFQ